MNPKIDPNNHLLALNPPATAVLEAQLLLFQRIDLSVEEFV